MTLPVITRTCLAAVVEKSVQTRPHLFAEEAMMQLKDEQPELTGAIMGLLVPIVDSESLDSPTIELILQTCFCVLGVTMRATNTQVEAEEMNKTWGETDE